MRLPALLAAAFLAAAPAAWATVAVTPYDPAALARVQAQGKPVLVEITAPWCPVCAKQKPVLAQVFDDPAYQGLTVYQIDFDSQKDAVRAMGATKQSTLIVFRGTAELGRSTGETDPDAIKALVAKVKP